MEQIKGRIIKSLGGFYYLKCEDGRELECRARGAFRNKNIKPCVGDWALAELTGDGTGYVQEILPRSNSLVRPPLANLDQLVLVVSIADPAPNALVLDKLIAIAEYQKIQPVVVVTKADLKEPDDFAEIYRKAGFPVAVVCSLNGEGVEGVKELLKGKFSAFCGNSGAGKSSLLNDIFPELSLSTAEISKKLGRGRHTTRHAELYKLAEGGYIADTPGFSTFETNKYDIIRKEELAACFTEFDEYTGDCRFKDCSHTCEKGCAVIAAMNEGKISESRHTSYCTMYEEANQLKEWELK